MVRIQETEKNIGDGAAKAALIIQNFIQIQFEGILCRI
jgi:hypothetical protein